MSAENRTVMLQSDTETAIKIIRNSWSAYAKQIENQELSDIMKNAPP